MAITIKFDSANNPLPSRLILATKSGNRIRELPISNVKFRDSFLNGSEFSFNVFKNHCVNKSGEIDESFWRRIVDFKIAYCPEFDMWYEIHLDLEESDETIKSCTAVSLAEAELSQINVYGIEVNTEADIARADYKPTVLFDPEDSERSLVDRLLYKAPHYSVKHVDYTIANIQRSFSFNDTSILDAYQEIATEINCLFIVEARKGENSKIERTISVYDLENYCLDCHNRGEFSGACDKCGSTNIKYGYGDDTSIFVSRKNLAQEISYSTDVDSVKNCFRLEGGDDLMTATIINCNPNGSQYLWYITDAMKSDMSDALRERLDAYDDLYAAYQNTESYSPPANLRTQYNEIVNRYKSVKSDLEEIPENIIGFPALMTAYYNTIDLQMFLNNSMMPNVETETTDAATEAAKLTVTNLSPVAVANLSTCTESTAASAVLSVAKCFVRGSFQVKVNESSYNANTYRWTGNFTVTNYSDEEDVATSPTITVSVTSELETFVKQKIQKAMAQQSDDPTSVSALFALELVPFKAELKKYSLQRLIAFRDVCQVSLDIMIQQGLADRQSWVSTQNNLYDNMYLPYYNKMSAIEEEIFTRTAELSVVVGVYDENDGLLTEGMQSAILAKRNEIQSLLNFEEYLGSELWLEFASFRREDTFTNKNYISDGLNNEEIFTRAEEFINLAQKEIYRSAVLQHSISSTLSNLLTMQEFQPIVDKFKVGNWLRIEVDGEIYRLRMIEYTIDYDSWSLSGVEFSDVKRGYSSASDIQSLLTAVRSMSSSYGSVSRQAQAGKKSQEEMENWVTDGFKLTSQKIVGGAANQEFEIGETGITGREYIPETEGYKDEQVKIISSGLYVTDDGWLTAKAGVGRFVYYNPVTKQMEEAYGVIADKLVGNLVLSQEVGIYNENSSITLDYDGFTLITEAGANAKTFRILRKEEDETLTNILSIDSNGNLLLNGYSTTGEMNSAISASAQSLTTQFDQKLEGYDTSAKVDSKLEVSAEEILTEVSGTYITSTDAENEFLAKSNGISSVSVEYAVGTSSSDAPESGWSAATPVWEEGKYVWQRTKTVNGNGSASYSNAVCIQGAEGEGGVDGYNTAVVNLYKRSQTAPTIDWSNDLVYSFVDHALTSVPTGWSQVIPNTNTDLPLYVTSAVASSRTSAATIASTDWVATPVLLVKNGDDAYTVILTNESHSFSGDTSKAIPANIDCNVIVYKGATQVPVTIGTITGAPTGMSTTISNNGSTSAKFNVAVTASMTSQNGTLTIPITVEGKAFSKLFTYTLVLIGRGISSITEMYKANNDKDNPPATSEFTTTIPTLDENNKYLWNYEDTTYTDSSHSSTERHIIAMFSEDGEEGRGITEIKNYYLATNTSSGVTRQTSGWSDDVSTQTVSSAKKYLWNYEKIVYTSGADGYTDPTIIGNYATDGVSATSYHLLSSHSVINKDEDGVYSPSSITLSAQSKTGNGAVESYSGRFKLEISSNNSTWTQFGNVSSQDETSHTWDISTIPSNTVALRGTVFESGGTTVLLDRQTFPIVSDGSPGQDGYTIILTNENHTFSGGIDAAIASNTDCNVMAFKGDDQVSVVINPIQDTPTGMTVTISDNGTTSAKFNVAVDNTMTTRNGTLIIPIVIDERMFYKRFSFSLALAGTSATVYHLGISHAAINKSESGVYNPSAIILTATSQTGSDPIENYLGRFKIESTTDNNTWTVLRTSSQDESSVTYNIANLSQNIVALRCSLYSSGGTTLLDQQVLPIVSDGYSGINSATVFLYQRAASSASLTKPTGVLKYVFATGAITGSTLGNWETSVPTSDGNPCFFIQASAISSGTDYDIPASAWSAIRTLVENGEAGVGVDIIENEYYLSNSASQPSGGSWSTDQPVWTSGKYIWTRSKITYSDNTQANPHVEYTEPVLAKAINAANQLATDVQQNLVQNYSTTTQTNEQIQNTVKSYQKILDTKADNLITYPYKNASASYTESGLTITVNEDGSVVVTGTSTTNVQLFLTAFADEEKLPRGPYTLSMGEGAEGASIVWRRKPTGSSSDYSVISATDQPATITYNYPNDYIAVYLNFESGKTYSFTAYPQLEYGETGHNWQPTSRSYQSQITQTATEIESRVTAVEETVASLDSGNLIPCPYSGSVTDNVAEEWKPGNAYTVNGITFTIETDGSITVNGTASAAISIDIVRYSQKYLLPLGTYTLVGNASATGITLQVYRCPNVSGNTTVYPVTTAIDAHNENGSTFAWTWQDDFFGVTMAIASGASFSNVSLKPTMVSGSTAHEWVSNVNTTISKVTSSESSIRQNAASIVLKVSVGDVSSTISQESGAVSITSNRMTITSDNFKLAANGEVTSNGVFSSQGVSPNYSTVQTKSVLNGGQLEFYKDSNKVGRYGTWISNSSDSIYGLLVTCDTSQATVIGVYDSTQNDIAVAKSIWVNNGANFLNYTDGFVVGSTSRFLKKVTLPKDLDVNGVVVEASAWSYSGYSPYYLQVGGENQSSAFYTNDKRADLFVTGNFAVQGNKNRVVETKNYQKILFNAVESTYCFFTDIGSGMIDETGVCEIWIDDDFVESVDLNHDYQVFTTRTSEGEITWVEKEYDHFIVHGTSGTTFDWSIYARQRDYSTERLERFTLKDNDANSSSNEDYTEEDLFRGDDIGQASSIDYMNSFEDNYDEQAEQYLRMYESEIEVI